METARQFDAPIRKPEEDLLEMKISARELARQIPTLPMPFTIGIYGEWGSGKTSFVELVESFLAEQAAAGGREVVFVDFTAWPHRTSDELWRALILRIARKLYKVQDDEGADDPAPPDSGRPGLLDRLAGLLRSEAAILHAPPPPVDPLAGYKRLVTRLDHSAASCDKTPDHAARLDQEQAMLATVQGAIAALGSLSPLVAGLRGLISSDSPRAAELLQRERNAATRERIESIEELRAILRGLFRSAGATKDLDKDENRCVCVFIDDLDRCMPDVALELLEAIAVFFTEGVHCVFLVAADAEHIGRGLQLRFREVGAGAQGSAELARKGQQYFEKIIQLGIPVPQPTPEQTYRLIAAQFPRWLPAGDILRAAVGDNPRRLKQYCNLLQYRLGVSWAQSGKPPDADMELLEKLIGLRAKRQGLADAGQVPLPTARILDRLADLRPHPEEVLQTRDAPFLRIFQMPELSAEKDRSETDRKETDRKKILDTILLQGLARLMSLRKAPASLLDALSRLAQRESWMDQMLALEKALEDRAPAPPEGLEPATVELFQAAIPKQKESQTDAGSLDLRAALVDQKPHLSAFLPEEVQAFLEVREELPEPEKLLTQEVYTRPSDSHKNFALAREALQRLRDRPNAITAIASGLDLRLKAALHVLELRRFAKLDALRHCWPGLERLLRAERWSDRVKLQSLERQAFGEEPRASDLLQKDERLEPFLKLRPFFREIYADDYAQFAKAAQATEGQTPTAPRPAPGTAAPVAEAASSEDLLLDYESAILSLVPPGGLLDAPEGRLPEYEITLTYKSESQGGRVTFDWSEIAAAVENPPLLAVRDTIGVAQQRALARDVQIARDFRPQDLGLLLREVGAELYDRIFPEKEKDPEKEGAEREGQVRKLFLELLARVPNLRLLLDMSRPELMTLPWESLYVRKPLRNHLALSHRYSLVRFFPPRPPALRPPVLRPPLPPLRILAMFPRPTDAAPLNVEGERRILERSLSGAVQSHLVQLQVLSPGEATVEHLSHRLRVFQPHLFHFVGHGLFLSEPSNEGALVFEDDDGRASPVKAPTLANFLRDNHVQLAVLNACDTATGAIDDAIAGVAGALINSGLPAVIATLRPIADEAALLFTREFYRAFVEGCPLEVALTEARKILSAEKWDWTAYALFTSLEDLDAFRFPAQPLRKQ